MCGVRLTSVYQVEAESQSDIAESFDIEAVPSFILLRVRLLLCARKKRLPLAIRSQGHTLLGRVNGADAPALTQQIAKHASAPTYTPLSRTDQAPAQAPADISAPRAEETPEELEQRLRKLMNQSQVVLFMKGSPDTPRCGFSRKIVGLLKDNGVQFTSFDILTDEAVRQGEWGIRVFSPRTYVLKCVNRRAEEVERLADVSPAHCQGRARWRIGYCAGDDQQRGAVFDAQLSFRLSSVLINPSGSASALPHTSTH